MQITSRFTIAVHIITAIYYFKDYNVTSSFLAGSVGVNPVIIREILGKLKKVGIVETSKGKSGITLKKDVDSISFYDIYDAIDCINEKGLFHFHENPNINCPVGKNIQFALNDDLKLIQNNLEEDLKKITLKSIINKIKDLDSK